MERRKEGEDFWREGTSPRGARLRSLRDSHTRRLPRDPLLVNNSLRDNGRAAASRVLLGKGMVTGRRLPPGGTVRLNVGAPCATPMPPQTETPLLAALSSPSFEFCVQRQVAEAPRWKPNDPKLSIKIFFGEKRSFKGSLIE